MSTTCQTPWSPTPPHLHPCHSGYGTYDADGGWRWAYSLLNNSNATVQAPSHAGETLTDTFTASTVDGTAQLVTITINGANDAKHTTGPVTALFEAEAGGVSNGAAGIPTATGDLASTDVDNTPPDSWTGDQHGGRRVPVASAAIRSPPPASGPTRSTTATPPCRRSMSATRWPTPSR